MWQDRITSTPDSILREMQKRCDKDPDDPGLDDLFERFMGALADSLPFSRQPIDCTARQICLASSLRPAYRLKAEAPEELQQEAVEAAWTLHEQAACRKESATLYH